MKSRAEKVSYLRPVVLLSVMSLELALFWGALLKTWDVASVDLFMRWRRRLGAAGPGYARGDIALVAIDKKTLDKYGLYGRSQWLTRKPFIDQLAFFANHYRPTVLAYDLLFQEILGEDSQERVSESPARLEGIRRKLDDLMQDVRDFVPEDILYDMTKLSAEQGDILFMRALDPLILKQRDTPLTGLLDGIIQTRRFPVVLAYNFRGGWIDPQAKRIEPWSDADVFGDDENGNEEYGERIPYLKDISIPASFLHFPAGGMKQEYSYSPNANLPGVDLLDHCRLGFINVSRDDDGVIRRVPLVAGFQYRNSITHEEKRVFVPSFALIVCMMHLGIEFPLRDTQPAPIEVFWGKEIVVRSPRGEEFHIPIDRMGQMYVNFNAMFNDFHVISFADVTDLDCSREINGSAVMVGISATGIDVGSCPISSQAPLVQIHAMTVNNILNRCFVAPLRGPRRLLPYCILVLVFTIVCLSEKTSRLAPVSFALAFLYGMVAYLGIHFNRVILPVVSPLLYIGFCSFTVMAYRYFAEERGKRKIRSLFSTMVSPEVLAYLEENPDSFSLEGHNVEATVFFSDIADFTALSESLPPERLTKFLNSYLTSVTDCIMNHGGYVDKFVGDLVMAVWGAPFPVSGHAQRACLAALEQQKVIRDLNVIWKREYGFEIRTRMGVNSGIVAAGSMGSERKLQYTVMGDVVNLASRLEPINRDYGTSIIIGEVTYRMLENDMITRPLDRIIVQGKTEVVPIYELMGVRGEVGQETIELAVLFKEGLQHYYGRDWAGALDILENILAHWTADAPSLNLRKRILNYRWNPPGKEWRGEHIRIDKD